ncbi:DUF92 domain-containing protein [Phaeodactylibacter luteus]|uniref:DUF92 domain-containing protein n=1 Tax=Phaeodactylibacter luteus TaxID=1564516 RepID=A0A5C6RGC5_9BACT|nr:DUF92 domain-containing protein [Phaeodactylibacter luteus]TXB61488.1 DUF92 domain-containing protein [Phaeodactylibacter luteus]
MLNAGFLIFLGSAIAYWRHWLSGAGAVAGGTVAALVFLGCGWAGISCLGLFFGLGVGATRFQFQRKERSGLAEKGKGRRGVGNVIGNGGIAAFVSFVLVWHNSLSGLPIVAGSLAAATSDTLSSELGNIYGKRFWDLRTFREGQKGMDGVISLEGSLAGLAGAAAMGALLLAWGGEPRAALIVVIAGLAGNVTDSFLGAFPERAGWLSNHAVNFISTACAALLVFLLL